MLALALMVVVGAEPSRAEIFQWLHDEEPSDGLCEVDGPKPWTAFVNVPHTSSTNALLMRLSTERGISAATQSRLASGLLNQHHDPAVVAFFLKRFDDSRDLQAAYFLLDTHREHVRRAFNTGHAKLDALIIRNSSDVEWLMSALKASSNVLIVDAIEEHTGKAFAEFALRSREPLLIDRLFGRQLAVSDELVIDGLSVASPSMRDHLDDVLAKRLMTSKSKNAFAKEWLSSKPRVGLARAPLTAYVLGTWAESTGDVARAKRLFDLGSKMTDSLLDELNADDSRVDLEGLKLAFTARLQKNVVVTDNVASAIEKQFTVRRSQR